MLFTYYIVFILDIFWDKFWKRIKSAHLKLSCLRYAREKDREKRERETVMTETHSDDGNTQWLWKHTVMMETHSDVGNTQWWQKQTVMIETHRFLL